MMVRVGDEDSAFTVFAGDFNSSLLQSSQSFFGGGGGQFGHSLPHPNVQRTPTHRIVIATINPNPILRFVVILIVSFSPAA
jgi:hypothetical protein